MSRLVLVLAGAVLSLTGVSCGGDDDDHDDSAAWERSYDAVDRDACSGIRVPDKGKFDKRIALTFDDGPNLETTPKILDVLDKHGISAVFLINGRRVNSEAARKLLRDMVGRGHLVGNHTQNHKDAKTLSLANFSREVEQTDEVLEELQLEHAFFRFPFGSSSCDTKEKVESFGYRVAGWHVDSADWCFAKGSGRCARETFKHVPDSFRSDMAAYTLSQVRSFGGGIVLFHDVHQNTANALDGIIERLKAEGYAFVRLDDAETFPKLNGGSPSAWIGSSCESDAACTFDSAAKCLMADGEAGVCSIRCEGVCPDRDGHPTTFCADVGGVGQCLLRSDAEHPCPPGTRASKVDRFVGQSSSKPATAEVCVP